MSMSRVSQSGRRWHRWLSALLVAATLPAAACPKAAQKPAASRKFDIPDSAESMSFGARVVLTDQGVNKGVLLADTALGYEDNTRLELRRINLTFYTSQGVRDGVMTARAGTLNQRLSRLEARGDVIIIREDGKRFTSPLLVFDQQRNQFFTDSAFVLTEPSRQLSGIGMESDPRLVNFKCLRACKGVAPVKVPTK
ncbi:MAG: LPS export ABC transporter periplasmic protein LptC [Gemmatimonadetes bacterium]|nr:LPS export ABC transporter periplasmic protein LptC [Gemmatimonadota bacterium]